MTSDRDVHSHINDLVAEEHRLRDADKVDRERLRHVEEQLDQLWDLLRQRQARREFGENPDDAAERPVDTVEHYRQ